MNIKKGFPLPQKKHWNEDDADNFKISVAVAVILVLAIAFITFDLLIRAPRQVEGACWWADEVTQCRNY